MVTKREQIEHLRAEAQLPGLPAEKRKSFLESAATLERLDKAAEAPIAKLPINASMLQIEAERKVRSVLVGEELFIPFLSKETVPIPNVLLRCALFSARAIPASTAPSDAQLVADLRFESRYGAVHIEAHGVAMGAQDRRVLAACVGLFARTPIATADGATSVTISFYKLVRLLGVGYSAESHRATMASLQRLRATSVTVRSSNGTSHVSPLVAAKWPPGSKLAGSDIVEVALAAPLASLYGAALWTAVPLDTLRVGRGLAAWLACFYASHGAPYKLPLVRLFQLSGAKGRNAKDGSSGDMAQFRGKLIDALNSLKELPEDNRARIRAWTPDKPHPEPADAFTVDLQCWNSGSRDVNAD